MKRAAALFLILLAILPTVGGYRVHASAVPDDFFLPDIFVSGSDADHSDEYDDEGRPLADFERVPMVPLNVEIPEFYQEVVNISGMYIFTLPDGTIYKRIYGAVNGRFGWYEPVGAKNLVYADAQLINVEDDKKLYYAAVDAAEAAASAGLYPGILPPESGVSRITSAFGMTSLDFFALVGGSAALLCLFILLGASVRRRRRNTDDDGSEEG